MLYKKHFLMKIAVAAVTAAVSFAACGNNNNNGVSTAAGGTAAGVSVSSAQKRVGVLMYSDNSVSSEVCGGFKAALADGGFVENGNIVFDFYDAGENDGKLREYAEKMAEGKYDLLSGIGTEASRALVLADKNFDVPIVFQAVNNPVGAGIVKSETELKTPSGNVTGTGDFSPVNKQIELMFQLVPSLKSSGDGGVKVGVIHTEGDTYSAAAAEHSAAQLKSGGAVPVDIAVKKGTDLAEQINAVAEQNVAAVYIPDDGYLKTNIREVSDLLNGAKIPAICGDDYMVQRGGLAAYSTDYYKLGRLGGDIGLRILNGAVVADVPVVYAEGFDFCYNADTAKLLGIDIPVELAEREPQTAAQTFSEVEYGGESVPADTETSVISMEGYTFAKQTETSAVEVIVDPGAAA